MIEDGTSDVVEGLKRMEIEDGDKPIRLTRTRTPSHEELLKNQDLIEWSGSVENSFEDSPSIW